LELRARQCHRAGWSSSPYVGYFDGTWVVNFGYYGSSYDGGRCDGGTVRLVRSGQ
jgi:hypothetical protein